MKRAICLTLCLCGSLAMLATVGCSQAGDKGTSDESPPVVQDLDIQPDEGDAATGDEGG